MALVSGDNLDLLHVAFLFRHGAKSSDPLFAVLIFCMLFGFALEYLKVYRVLLTHQMLYDILEW